MDKIVSTQMVGGNPTNKRAESDFYPTPPEVTHALLHFLGIPKGTVVWEPACGEGDMVEAMKRSGLSVVGTDIQTGTDFLTEDIPRGVSWIITNPPFSLSEQFIRKCAQHGKPFALLLKSQYWHAARRVSLFHETPPAFVLPLTWRPDFLFKKGGRGSPLMDVIWCVWFPGNRMTEYIPLAKPDDHKLRG